MAKKIDHLIINSPYEEPKEHWRYNEITQGFDRVPGRRKAGYTIATPGAYEYNDGGRSIDIPLVNEIRGRVKNWREQNYPGITGVTRALIGHWRDTEVRRETKRLFFCQIDAAETLIWLTEARDTEKTGIAIEGDGGAFKRICTKLCTGGGKTTVMAMLIAWQVCNKAAYPQDKRFSKNVLIIAPGLTVKSRLQVLKIGGAHTYYAEFDIVPVSLQEKLYQGKVVIENWQSLAWETAEDIAKKKNVDKRGPKSDEAYARQVLGEISKARNILVINDEAHHAWRRNPENTAKLSREYKEAEREATIWISGLDRIHAARNIRGCYDFSATPFAPSGKKNGEDALFSWIVSNFGLEDGIESGLVKTPRIAIRDDNAPSVKDFRSKLYHIYRDETVQNNLSQAAKPETPLPDLVIQAYNLLGADWLEVYKQWNAEGKEIPPVMITVANRTETAARIQYAFEHKRVITEELCDPNYMIHIDSKTLEKAEILQENSDDTQDRLSQKDRAGILRETVDTVGQIGKRGAQIRNVISVGMLTEGWDAKTVTHILGLRAFSSQLLCEQVVGRGLRRSSYEAEANGLFAPEYVNVFGIPFFFLPHEEEDEDTAPSKKRKPTLPISVNPEHEQYEITWPNIIRIDRVIDPIAYVNFDAIPPLTLDASKTRVTAELAPFIEGKPDFTKLARIDLEKLEAHLRMQEVLFKTTAQVYETCQCEWKSKGTTFGLIGQVFRWVERYIASGRIIIEPALYTADPLKIKLMYILNMQRIAEHICNAVKVYKLENSVPVFDPIRKTGSTRNMPRWFTSRPHAPLNKSHISHCVYDSAWEAAEACKLERNPLVTAFAKNDHLDFSIWYRFEGVPHRYYPDFLVKLANGKTLALETKGQKNPQAEAKRSALEEWVTAVNYAGGYGKWVCDISFNIADIDGIIAQHAAD
ncbi:MAG: DEAD/DEAH box helicase family protein [Spirochaetaceae bacterium]|jgi:type III restriction enzyme|nr:DEAD/DEAH box helicase family protein [Spirochaetaceae bacterium]